MRLYKKGQEGTSTSIRSLLVVVIMLLVIGLGIYFIWKLIIVNNNFKSFTGPKLSAANDLLSAEYIGYYDNKILDFNNLGQVPAGCKKDYSSSSTRVICSINTKIDFYVGIKNTGSKASNFYANPRIGYSCDSGDSCSEEYWIVGTRECEITTGAIVDCPTDVGHVFDKTGNYKVFAGANCLAQDCSQVYNKNNYVEVSIQ